mgnify:CR=1 FL=1
MKTDDFETLWQTHPILKELRNKDLEKDNCGKCEYRYYCGGCRARAYGYLDDYLGEDIGCMYNKKTFDTYIASLKKNGPPT